MSYILQTKLLQKIGGTSGSSDGVTVMRSVVKKLIFTEFMSAISWTGKSNGGKKKIKFQGYANLIQLISNVCISADSSLTEQIVLRDLKYKVIKYAYTRPQTSTPSPTPTTSSVSPDPTSEDLFIPLVEVATTSRSDGNLADEAERERTRSQQNTIGNIEQRHTYQQQKSNSKLTKSKKKINMLKYLDFFCNNFSSI